MKQRYRTAVGLTYCDDTDGAPSVTVKGKALVADEIVRIARRFGVPVVVREGVADALEKVELDHQIPAEMYEAVAVLLNELEKREKG